MNSHPSIPGDMIIRHNSLRNLVEDFETDAKLSPVLEKQGILGNTTGRRPGDVTFEKWAEGKGLAIDVAVTSPLAPTRMVAPCEWCAATQKHAKYDLSFVGTNYLFSAMVFETLGAINTEGEELLPMLFRFASKRLGREFTSYCGRAWSNLQRSVQCSPESMDVSSVSHKRLFDKLFLALFIARRGLSF